MASLSPVPPETFAAIQYVDIEKLSDLPSISLRAILPCLVRMSLCPPLDASDKWTKDRKMILKCLSGIEVVNSLVGLLSIDFHALEQDAKKEQQLRAKIGGTHSESILISQLDQSLPLVFERSDAAKKLRLLLSELLFIISQIKGSNKKSGFYLKSSELFESEVYLEEVSDVLCIAQAELPHLLPVVEVAEALIHVSNGAWLLSRLVANVPHTFNEVCVSLVTNHVDSEETVGSQRRWEALNMLCTLCPAQALNVRRICVENRKLPNLVISLTLSNCTAAKRKSPTKNQSEISEMDHSGQSTFQTDQSGYELSEVVAFVSGLFFSADTDTRTWFAQYIKQEQKLVGEESLVGELRSALLGEMRRILPGREDRVINTAHVVHGCVLLRLYCALKTNASLKFTEDEMLALLDLITCRPAPSTAGVRFISLALCVLISHSQLISSLDQERCAVDWIRWLLREAPHFEKVCGGQASFSEMLLLISIHFHGGQNSAIADLVSTMLGVKGAVRTGTLTKLKVIFTQEIFTDQVVTSHAVNVPVTQSLSADIPGYLPIHCIHQLVKSRAFSKNKVPIKDWIYRQLCQCTTPLHPLVPELIEVYVHSILLPSVKTDRTNEPITEQEIRSQFENVTNEKTAPLGTRSTEEGVSDQFTTRLLLAFYVLLYQDFIYNRLKQISAHGREAHRYSAQLLSEIPVKSLLQEAQKKQHLYVKLVSQLLRLLVTHYPHLCMVEDWLEEESVDCFSFSSSDLSLPDLPCSPHNVQKGFDHIFENTTGLLIHLRQLLSLPVEHEYIEVLTSNLPRLLTPGVPRSLLELTKQLWTKYHAVSPTVVRVLTVNALSNVSTQKSLLRSEFTEDDMTLDPLIVLRCDSRVFRCPQLMSVILRILQAFLQASRLFLTQRIQMSPAATEKSGISGSEKCGVSVADQEELRTALVAAQESAAAQILLETCLPTQTDKESGTVSYELREVQSLVCSHLHHMFIADPNLAKLIHFQGYPQELLPVTVAGIPSMHICLDFISELISQPDIDKQMFAVNLISHLCVQFSLPKSLGVARLAVNVMNTLLSVLDSENRLYFYQATVPALARIAGAFPPLVDEIVSLLTHLGQVCRSQLAGVASGHFTDILIQNPNTDFPTDSKFSLEKIDIGKLPLDDVSRCSRLLNTVYTTFSDVVSSTTLLKHQLK